MAQWMKDSAAVVTPLVALDDNPVPAENGEPVHPTACPLKSATDAMTTATAKSTRTGLAPKAKAVASAKVFANAPENTFVTLAARALLARSTLDPPVVKPVTASTMTVMGESMRTGPTKAQLVP